ncbi:DUF3221 domain-containing protein [Lysinibacillus pakistanensis]|uniref:DUF3221 domain-containing protein n=1 Tax=Lysinibacillus pakistanensis TaxID=759811 RepID=UPI003D29AE8B
MKKIILVCMIILILASCGTANGTKNKRSSATMEGYITAAEDGRYLVVSNEPVYLNNSNPQFVNALWVSTTKKLAVGDYVKVWAGAINESYPGQTSTDKIQIVPSNLNSTLSTNEVLSKVAENLEYTPIITNIKFDAKKNIWTLHYKIDIAGNDTLVGMVIQDQKPISLGQPIYEQPPQLAFAINEEEQLSLYLQQYSWTYTDIKTGEKKQKEHETPLSNIQASFYEAIPLQKPEKVKLMTNDLDILHSEIVFLDEQMNKVAKIINEDGTYPIGTYYMHVKVQFEQGTATYMDTIQFK